jgi:hypothetical protein
LPIAENRHFGAAAFLLVDVLRLLRLTGLLRFFYQYFHVYIRILPKTVSVNSGLSTQLEVIQPCRQRNPQQKSFVMVRAASTRTGVCVMPYTKARSSLVSESWKWRWLIG